MITLAGFALSIVSHIVLVYYQGMSMEGRLPDWVPIMVGVNYFVYIFLDNVDGKQARRTHSSSVLGMLVDHGCDAYTSVIVACNLTMVVQAGLSEYSILPCFVSTIPFFFATLESYFIGGVYLPEINAVSDGCIAYMFVCFGTVYLGYEELTALKNGNMRISHYSAYAFIPASIIFTLQNIYCIFFKEKRVRKGNIRAVSKAVLYVLITSFILNYCGNCFPESMLKTAPLLVSYLFGLLLLRPINLMQLHLVTAQPMNLWRRGSILTLIILMITHVYADSLGVGIREAIVIYSVLIIFNLYL